MCACTGAFLCVFVCVHACVRLCVCVCACVPFSFKPCFGFDMCLKSASPSGLVSNAVQAERLSACSLASVEIYHTQSCSIISMALLYHQCFHALYSK